MHRSEPCSFAPLALQVEAALAGALCERADPPVVLVAATVEDDRGHPRGLRALRERAADRASGVDLARRNELALAARGGGQGATRGVVDDLGVDVLRAAEDRQARALLAAADAEPESLVSLATQDVA